MLPLTERRSNLSSCLPLSSAHRVFHDDGLEVSDEAGQLSHDINDSISFGFGNDVENDFGDLFVCQQLPLFLKMLLIGVDNFNMTRLHVMKIILASAKPYAT